LRLLGPLAEKRKKFFDHAMSGTEKKKFLQHEKNQHLRVKKKKDQA